MVVFLLLCFFRLSPAISVTWENAATLPRCDALERFHGDKKPSRLSIMTEFPFLGELFH